MIPGESEGRPELNPETITWMRAYGDGDINQAQTAETMSDMNVFIENELNDSNRLSREEIKRIATQGQGALQATHVLRSYLDHWDETVVIAAASALQAIENVIQSERFNEVKKQFGEFGLPKSDES